MASSVQTGISAAAVNRYLRGPGKVYKDFTSVAVPGTLLGETKGGSVFDWGLTFHDVEPDGAMGLIEGHRFISMCVPSLQVNLLEHTTTNWLGFLPGADSADETPTKNSEDLGVGTAIDSPGVALEGAGDVDASTLEIWYGAAGGGAYTKATIDTDYTFTTATGTVIRAGGGSIGDTDRVIAIYEYDSTSSGDAYTVITPGQIAAADHWTNVTLLCELSNQSYTNPYCVFQIKNPLSEPSTVSIPGGAVEETILNCTFKGFFNPDTGLSLAYAPVEFWLGKS